MNRALGAAAGTLLDLTMGELPWERHPVAVFGSAMTRVERHAYRDTRAAGVAHALVGAAAGWAVGSAVRSTAAATWVVSAGRGLADAAIVVDRHLATADLVGARAALPALVGRDPSHLDESDIARAVVESVAENTVDAVVAPGLWAAVAGARGACLHRAVNTLDSMVGHHSERYERFGWASARLDDAMAFVPARVTAALVATVRPRAAGRVWTAVRTQAPGHPSPNAGVAEAAFAAALGVQIGGINRYGERVEVRPVLGFGPAPTRADIARATSLCRDVTLALAGVLVAIGLAR